MESKNIPDVVKLDEKHDTGGYTTRLVNYQPISHTELKVKSYPLDQIKEQRVQEALVVRDLLNVLMGLEGVYIRYNNSYDPNRRSAEDLRGPDYKIAKNMDLSLKSFAKRIVKLGKMYSVLTDFSEWYNQPVYGSILHKLCQEIRRFLTDVYLRWLVEGVEYEYKNNVQFSIRDIEQVLNQECIYKTQLLYELVQDICREMARRAMMDRNAVDFDNFIHDLKMDEEPTEYVNGAGSNGVLLMADSRVCPYAKGGVVLQIVQNHLRQNWGNQNNVTFLRHIFQSISNQYCTMLQKWLLNGDLEDPYDEFMITDTVKKFNAEPMVNSLNSERLWDTQYVIRKDGLMEQFLDKKVQFKILMTGKLLNVIKASCDVQSLASVLPLDIRPLQEIPKGTQLALYLDAHYKRANQLTWTLLYDGYNLPHILRELQRNFLLFNNANFFKNFLTKGIVELTKMRTDSVQIKLQRLFSQFQRCDEQGAENIILPLMNLQLDKNSFYSLIEQFSSENTTTSDNSELLQARNFDNLRDMLMRDLGFGSADERSNDVRYSIHHIQFEILMPFPLNVLISRPYIVQYQLIQRYLLLLHYYNRILEDTWFELNKNKIWRHPGFAPDVARWIRRCRIVHNHMSQFMKVILEFTTLDVIHSESRILEQYINNTNASSFEFSTCQMHIQDFLTNIMSHSLLTNGSLVRLLLQTMEIVHKYCKFVTSLRKTLCLIDFRLYEHYRDQLPQDHFYDEATSITKLQELHNYLEVVGNSFLQHRAAFAEGVRFYSEHGSTRVGGNLISTLADRLSSEMVALTS